MGSAAETVDETVEHLVATGRIGRPASGCVCIGRFHRGIWLPRCRRACAAIAVLDRCKEPGSEGEPLYKDVLSGIADYISSGGDRFICHATYCGAGAMACHPRSSLQAWYAQCWTI